MLRVFITVFTGWSAAPVVLGCGGARLGLGDVKVSTVQWMHDTAWVRLSLRFQVSTPSSPRVIFHFSVPCSITEPAFWYNPDTEVVVFPTDRAYFNIPVAGFREESSFSWT